MKRVPLTQGYFATVDDEDYQEISKHRWHVKILGRKKYAGRHGAMVDGKRGFIMMHRAIMSPPDGLLIDHRNHDGLDNTRSNLRVCTYAENGRNRSGLDSKNTSGFRGVCYRKEDKKFQANIHLNGKNVSLGYFPTAEAAGAAYVTAARAHYGEFFDDRSVGMAAHQ